MQKVEEAVQKKQQWMHEQLQKFENLPKSTDPPVTIAQISAEAKVPISTLELSKIDVCILYIQLLSTTCDPIVNKPKPKVEPPKDEGKKEEEKKENEGEKKDNGDTTQTGTQDATDNSQSAGDSAGTENTTNNAHMDVD